MSNLIYIFIKLQRIAAAAIHAPYFFRTLLKILFYLMLLWFIIFHSNIITIIFFFIHLNYHILDNLLLLNLKFMFFFLTHSRCQSSILLSHELNFLLNILPKILKILLLQWTLFWINTTFLFFFLFNYITIKFLNLIINNISRNTFHGIHAAAFLWFFWFFWLTVKILLYLIQCINSNNATFVF